MWVGVGGGMEERVVSDILVDHNHMCLGTNCLPAHRRGQTCRCHTYPWLDRCKLSAGRCGHLEWRRIGEGGG